MGASQSQQNPAAAMVDNVKGSVEDKLKDLQLQVEDLKKTISSKATNAAYTAKATVADATDKAAKSVKDTLGVGVGVGGKKKSRKSKKQKKNTKKQKNKK